ncbi:hypothetical protein ACM66B_004857 [Microbotryomycetes sp. NB124-2]
MTTSAVTPEVALELRLRYLEALLVPPPPHDGHGDGAADSSNASVLRRVSTINETLSTATDTIQGTEAIKRFISSYDLNEPLLKHQSTVNTLPRPTESEDLSVNSKLTLLLDFEQDVTRLERDLREIQVFDEKDVVGAGRLAEHEHMAPELEEIRKRLAPLSEEYAALDTQALALLERYSAHISNLSEKFIAWNDVLTAAEQAVTNIEKQRSKPLDVD